MSSGSALPAVLVAAAVLFGACQVAPRGTTSPTSPPGPTPSPTGAAHSPSPPPPAEPTPRPSPAPLVYVVVPGDTLSAIARRFATDVRSLSNWNRSAYPSLDPESPSYDPNQIEVGWHLVVFPGVVLSDDDLPSPPATPTPSATVAPGRTPQPVGASRLLSHGPRDSSFVALTFDLGGRLDPALAIMDWLLANRVPATIFPTGKTASETAVGRRVVERVAAHPDLFALGNHSWNHPDFTTLSAAEIASQLVRTEEVIEDATGRTTKPWFRPPYGAQNSSVREAVGAAGWAYVVMWDVDTIDWKPETDGGPTADDIVAKVRSRAQGGSIVLMHLGGHNTLETLPRIVEGLRDRGLQPVTLDTMFGR